MGYKKLVKLFGVLSVCVLALAGSRLISKADTVSKEDKINNLIKIAQNEVGYAEDASGVTKYGQWWTDRTGDSAYAKASWSCMFLSWCGKEAGFSESEYGFFSYTGYWISWFESKNAYYAPDEYEARKGDILFYDSNKDGRVDSAGIVEKNGWNRITVIKGNVNGQTTRVKYKESDKSILGYGSFYDKENSNDENNTLQKPKLGIDVSSYNGDIDWEQVKQSGVEYAYIRLGYRGYGASGTLVTDKAFVKNIEGAIAVGIDVGVYFVTQAITVEEAIEEAEFVKSKIKDYNITYPVAIDTEQASPTERSKDLTKNERTAIIKAFYDKIESYGYRSQIYSGKYWFRDKLDMDQLQGYDIWVAEYTYDEDSETSFSHPYSVWQYSDKGRILGISSDVDMNQCYINYIQENSSGLFDWLKNYFN